MYLDNITLLNFKNYSELDMELSPKINCFTGNNGAGKTNVLDAIYYLSFCKSFFTSIDAMNIRHESKLFVIQGKYSINNHEESIYCGFEVGKKKKFKRNKKEYDKLAEHIGLIPLVMITPSDINLILGGSDERRKFMDGVISQFDRTYLFHLQRYNRTLAQRNTMLKDYGKTGYLDNEVIQLYNEQLAEAGQYIFDKRHAFIQNIEPVFQKFFAHISGGQEQVKLVYNSDLHQQPLPRLLNNNTERDKAARYTTKGIHKDDLDLLLGNYPIRKLGSQGQQKTYLIALKLAQFEYIYQLCGFKPLLLLDDVFDKLDSQRVQQIITLVAQNSFGQIFITDTNPDRVNNVLSQVSGSYYHFHVTNAQIEKINEKNEHSTA